MARARPHDPERKGHGCLALYVMLADKGFISAETLDTFCRPDSILGGHPEAAKIPGVEASTGSLGHGLSYGLGMALAARIEQRDTRVFIIMGDGEINEGSVWEAALCAGKHRLTNLTAIIDYNKLQSAGPTREIQDLEPLADKWRAFGFAVEDVDGHDVAALRSVFHRLPFAPDRPSAIICHTVKGKGLPFAENDSNWHHKAKISGELVSEMYAALERLMRNTCLNMVYELAKRDHRTLFIGSDLSPGLLAQMKREMPERYYMEGVTEANIIGMAAGLAMDGYIPFVNTIATFITRRCSEQIAIDLCLHNLPVRLIGNGGGLVYAPLGPTHLAIEDIAIMRALPNMTVIAVCDAAEMERMMECSLDWPQPIYIRLAKGGDPVVSRGELGFTIGKAIVMREGRTSKPVVLMATGVMTTNCLAAADALEAKGVDTTVVHFHTVKPLDEAAVLEHAKRARLVVTAEEGTMIGGFGSAVTDLLTSKNSGSYLPNLRLGLPDLFPPKYGVQEDLFEVYGLTANQIAQRVAKALNNEKMVA
jgi:transketolase